MKVKAAVLYKPQDIRVEDFEIPDEIPPDHVLVRIHAATLCPTDIRKYKGHVTLPKPAILGHECAGIVEKVGRNVTSVVEGDKVWISSIIGWCGKCKYCRKGQINLCESLETLGFAGGSIEKGYELQARGTIGVFSEYTIVPEIALLKLGDEIPLDKASMIEPLSSIIKCMHDMELSPGDEVVVIGCGPMGLLHINVAKALGAGRIIAVEPIEERRKMALELGADKVINPFEENAIERVKELTDGLGADIAIVAVGGQHEAKCVMDALHMVCKGGRVNIFAGTYPKRDMTIDPNIIHYREITLKATFGFTTKEPYEAFRLLKAGRLNVEKVRTPVYPLDEAPEAFKVYGTPGALKVGLNIE